MLKRISDIEFESELEEFGNVLDKCDQCTALATLKQIVTNLEGEGANSMDLQDINCEVNATVSLTNEYVYVNLYPKNKGGMADLKRIRNLWKTALHRNTSRMRENKKPDYSFLLELVHMDDSLDKLGTEDRNTSSLSTTYMLSFFEPLIISMEENEFMAVYSYEHSTYGVEQFNAEELEYQMMLNDEANNTVEPENGIADDVDDTTETETENEEIVGNDDILNV